MKALWVTIALLIAVACGVLGVLVAKRKPMAVAPGAGGGPSMTGRIKDLVDPIKQLENIDPKLFVCKESARFATGLKELRGVSVGPEDRIYAVGDKALLVLSSDGTSLSRVDLGKPPTCVAVGADGAAYVGMQEHVEVFDAKGARKAVWEDLGPKSWITSIAVSESEVFVADFGEKWVLRYDLSGKRVGKIVPDPQKKDSRFEVPSPHFDVQLDGSGGVWIAHTGQLSVENYRSDGSLVTKWGKQGNQLEGFSGCCNPADFAIRKDGSFVTSEKGMVRVKLHRPSGEVVGVVAGPKDFQKDVKGLDLAVDSKDRILVVDPGTSSIRVYVDKAKDSSP